jgi:hypothetical protein
MNSKRKASFAKKNWRAGRRKYTWYFRSPFKAQFDRSHWWKKSPNNEPCAALYELARRHPLVRETWLKNFAANTRSRWNIAIWLHKQGLPGTARLPAGCEELTKKITLPPIGSQLPLMNSLGWTCFYGLKSWANLTLAQRESWKRSVGKIKGLDFRWDIDTCESVSSRLAFEAWSPLNKLINPLCPLTNPQTASEWETAIAHWAVEAHRQGKVLLAVAPDLDSKKAGQLMVKTYRDHLRLYAPATPPQRARWEQWLDLIEEFEDDETSPAKAKSQVFARYRRAVVEIRFK